MIHSLLSNFASLLLSGSGRQRLSTLIYHRVLNESDYLRPGEPTVEQFDWQMKLLSKYFTPLALADAIERLCEGTLPANAVCVTFDDGYADNLTAALPILKTWGIPATVFVATGFLDGGRMWNDTVIEYVRLSKNSVLDLAGIGLGVYPLGTRVERLRATTDLLAAVKYTDLEQRNTIVEYLESTSPHLPDYLMLTSKQLKELHLNGVEIGGHTHSHPILAKLESSVAYEEIKTGKNILEDTLDHDVSLFAYPNGKADKDYHAEHVNLVKRAGFSAAVCTDWGVSVSTTDRYQLRRFTPWDKTPARFYARMLRNMKGSKAA